LGAVLYELLIGTTPLNRDHYKDGNYVDLLKTIREAEPILPSVRLRQSATSAEIAAHRQSDPKRLPKLFRGELDWITMKALDKDRTRRYETVNSLSRDLQRYLDGDAVEAGPVSKSYRLMKFARKHRYGLLTAGAFIALLVASSIISTAFAIRARRAEQQ